MDPIRKQFHKVYDEPFHSTDESYALRLTCGVINSIRCSKDMGSALKALDIHNTTRPFRNDRARYPELYVPELEISHR